MCVCVCVKWKVEAAVKAAKEAFPGWSDTSPADRARVLNQLADLIEARLEDFAKAESKDQGNTTSTLFFCSIHECFRQS